MSRQRRKGFKRVGARAFPLRTIVGRRMEPLRLADGTLSEYAAWAEVLECGHTMFPRSDIFGETNASARRCSQCAKQKGAA
jgi:hypothetical protein